MDVKISDGVIMIEGNLDETNSSEGFDQVLKNINGANLVAPIPLDLSKVPRANSYGILLFLRFLKGSNLRFKYVNSPTWLVEQFNMISQFLVNDSFVESIQVPYFCEDDESEEILTLQIGKDIPVLESYADFKLEDRKINGKEYEPDVSPERYLSFISAQFDSFRDLR